MAWEATAEKGREAELVAEGIKPAEKDDDGLELDECCIHVLRRSRKRWLGAQALSANPTGRSVYERRPFSQNLQSALEPDAGGGDRTGASVTSESPIAQYFRKTPKVTAWTTTRSESSVLSWTLWNGFTGGFDKSWPNTSGGRERSPNENERSPLNDKTVRGVVRESRHLVSTRYQK